MYSDIKISSKMKQVARMTTNQYSIHSHDISYLLPFDYKEQSEHDLLEQVKELLTSNKYYKVEQKSIEIKYDKCVVVEYLYEGWGEYHCFELEFEVIYLSDINKLILSGGINQAVHDLFELIIRDTILPEWSKIHNLKEYSYYDFYPFVSLR
jgi:hypothetical protein